MFYRQDVGKLTLMNGLSDPGSVLYNTWLVWDEASSVFTEEGAGVAEVSPHYFQGVEIPRSWLPGC